MKTGKRILAAVLCIATLVSVCIISVTAQDTEVKNPETAYITYINEGLSKDMLKTGKSQQTLLSEKAAILGLTGERAVELELTSGIRVASADEALPFGEVPDCLEYSIYNGEAIIECFTGNPEYLIIPGEINGYPVTITSYAFEDCKSLKQVVICEGITKINIGAFYDCENLESIILPSSLVSVGSVAFARCSKLKSINIPANVSRMGSTLFWDDTALERVTLPLKTTSYADSMFESCTSLKSIEIPEGVTTLGNEVFRNCKSLERVSLPDSLRKIGTYCFQSCKSLAEIEIPKGVKELKHYTFSYCNSLTKVVLPEGLERIGDYTFGNCINLEIITLPDSLKKLDRQSFHGCSSLKRINIPEGVEAIKEYTFTRCTNLRAITIGKAVTEFEPYAFYLCTSLKDVYFEGIEESWLRIETGDANDSILKANIHFEYSGEELPTLSTDPVEDTNPATWDSVEITDDNGIKYLVEGRNATVIGYVGTADEVTVPGEVSGAVVREIGMNAFSGCESLKSIYISEGVEIINSYAFSLCINLEKVHLPYSLKELCGFAFYSCDNVKKVTYGGSEDSWEEVSVGLSNDSVTKLRNFHYLSEPRHTHPTISPTEPELETDKNRFYFYMPSMWEDAENSELAGIYWEEGTDAPEVAWGYPTNRTAKANIYYFDVPADVKEIRWNNLYNGAWYQKSQTDFVRVDGYEKGESKLYPDGLDSMNGMIFIVYKEKIGTEDSISIYTGDWYYYYGNGEYGTAKNKADADKVYTVSTMYSPDSTDPAASITVPVALPFERGDVNMDKELNIKDATAIQKFVAKLLEFDENQLYLADINFDSRINIKDATRIQKKIANLI